MSPPQKAKNRRDYRVFDSRFCHRCRCHREFSRRTTPHLWHLGLTLITFGLWGVAWATVAVQHRRRPWRCSVCRSRYLDKPPSTSPQSSPSAGSNPAEIAPRRSAITSYRKEA